MCLCVYTVLYVCGMEKSRVVGKNSSSPPSRMTWDAEIIKAFRIEEPVGGWEESRAVSCWIDVYWMSVWIRRKVLLKINAKRKGCGLLLLLSTVNTASHRGIEALKAQRTRGRDRQRDEGRGWRSRTRTTTSSHRQPSRHFIYRRIESTTLLFGQPSCRLINDVCFIEPMVTRTHIDSKQEPKRFFSILAFRITSARVKI